MRTLRCATALRLLLAASLASIWGCAAMEDVAKVGTAVGESAGVVTKDQAQSINRSAAAVSKAAEDFTPEQEYYIGRSVGAVLVTRYKPYNNAQANGYINVIGQALAQASDRPETFGGYHFLVLDSNEINAFATPGGLVFVTRGMLRLCKNEDEVAAVLAHEIAHVELRHGIQSIEKGRRTEALKVLAVEGTKSFGKKELADLTATFESSIGDITSTLINNGYSRGFEREADVAAVRMLSRVGYNPSALAAMLREMEKGLKPGGPDFAKTHPSPASRIGELPSSATRKLASVPPARQARFEKSLGEHLKAVNLSPAARKAVSGAAVAIASVALAFLLWAAGAFERWELRTWDWRASVMARPAPSTDRIRLVLLDQQSLDWAQKENGLSWPWPREVYGAIIGYLRRAGARSISFDVLYTEPSAYGVADDAALGNAIAGAGDFVGAVHLGEKSGGAASWPEGYPAIHPRIRGLERWMSAREDRGVTASRGLFPIPEIAAPAFALADVQHNPDADGIYRRTRLFRVYDGKTIPSFALASRMVSSPGLRMSIREGSLTVDDRTVPIDAHGNAILRFRGPSGTTYRQYSAAAVIQSELKAQAGEEPVIRDPDAFRGRHVIFGFSAPGLYDLRSTPVGGVFPGSEIHATALDNLLEGDFLSAAGPAATFAAALLLSLLSAFAVVFSRKVWQSLLLFAVLLPLPVLLCLLAYSLGWWLPLVVQEAAVSLSLLGALAVNYATEGKQKRFIKGAFRQYLSPAVIDQLIEHPERLKLGGERRTVSIFFSDIQGFTGISEGLDPEALTALLNEYLSAMTDILQEEGGTVDKYIGDAIVAFWNAPLDQPDHAERAARSALRCQEKLAEMRPALRERIGKDLFMRVGLNTGVAVVGNMGSRNRFDYTVLGDAVNLASRLEGINKQFGTYILASEAMRGALPERFPAREISRVSVVGRREPVRVFELLSRKDTEAREKERSSFAEGLRAFTAGNFPAALETFLSTAETDPAAAAYARKCKALIERPPERWEGVWVMTEK